MSCFYSFRRIKIESASFFQNKRSILVLCDLSLLPVYLLQQQRQVPPHQHKWDELAPPLSLAAQLIYHHHLIGVGWMMNV